jgi:hypothetical protein
MAKFMNTLFLNVFLRRQPSQSELEVLLRQEIQEIKAQHRYEMEQALLEIEKSKATRSKPEMKDQETTTDTEKQVWMRNFPHWAAANLETKQVLTVENADYVFVLDRHPVVYVLENNLTTCNGIHIRDSLKIDGRYYKITKPDFAAAVAVLKTMHPWLYA